MKERGQGLVEMALILPFLLVLVVGMVELGVALNRQITVVNAAREGARFGATGASPGDIYEVTLSATSQMFDFAEGDSVVFVVHAEVNGAGDDFEEWIVNAWPEGSDAPHVTPGEVLAELQAEGNAAGVKLVVVDVEYDHHSLLGLPVVGAVADRIPVGSWAAMRLEQLSTGARRSTCCVLPIALDVDAVDEDMVDIRFGGGSGTFGWLYWDPMENGNAGYLEANLHDPCRVAEEFKDACDYTDTTLNVGDWVAGDTGESVSEGVRHEIEARIGYRVRIPLWDRFETCSEIGCACQPGSQAAHVVGFAIVEVTDVDLTGSPKTISARFVRMDEGCQ